MKRNIILGIAGLVLGLALLSLYVAMAAGPHLNAARNRLSGRVTQLSARDMRDARARLLRARDSLDSPPASVLRALPLIGHNLRAADDFAGATAEVLDSGLALHRTLDRLSKRRLLAAGRVDLAALHRLRAPLEREVAALAALEAALARHLNGWVLPVLWDGLDDGIARAREIRASAQRVLKGLELAGAMLGERVPRTYLVVLLNNAELRGAGGIPSGAGTLVAAGGRLRLGDFQYTPELRGARIRRVRAPEEFARRFGQYGADTTLWVNTTFSPDVPDVASVAARLYEVATGVAVDGVLFADPRGISALLPAEREIEAPGTGKGLTAHELPEFAYVDAYREFEERGQPLRRDTLLAVGKAAFAAFVDDAQLDRAGLERIGAYAAGGHLRVVMFDAREQALLDEAGLSGSLEPPAGDSLLVTAQNFGGDKLDYFARRGVGHDCTIEAGAAYCTTTVELANRTPANLPPYMAGLSFGEVYGLLKSFVEVYVPEKARVTSVEVDGRPSVYFAEPQAGRIAVGVSLEIPRRARRTLTITYDLALSGRYELEVLPQPLSRDAHLTVSLRAPTGWTLRGPGHESGNEIRYDGAFDRAMQFRAAPKRARGLTGLWTRLIRFWKEPLF